MKLRKGWGTRLEGACLLGIVVIIVYRGLDIVAGKKRA